MGMYSHPVSQHTPSPHPVHEEPRWHAAVAVIAALALYVTLPQKVIVGRVWLLPLLVLVILVPLLVSSPRRHKEQRWQRTASIMHIAVLNAFNLGTIVLLCMWQLDMHHHKALTGEELLRAAVKIWITNVIVFALWFWELDGGGPDTRAHATFEHHPKQADFLFPQLALDPAVRERLAWKPQFLDYLFLAFTNATAFSPADTFPLTRLAKVLMMTESLASLVTISVIAARAIGVIGT